MQPDAVICWQIFARPLAQKPFWSVCQCSIRASRPQRICALYPCPCAIQYPALQTTKTKTISVTVTSYFILHTYNTPTHNIYIYMYFRHATAILNNEIQCDRWPQTICSNSMQMPKRILNQNGNGGADSCHMTTGVHFMV